MIFDADEAERWGNEGEKVILVREETKPEDIHGFFASQGILTCRGGKTSHAAVVARGMGKPCVSGGEDLHIDLKARVGRRSRSRKGTRSRSTARREKSILERSPRWTRRSATTW